MKRYSNRKIALACELYRNGSSYKDISDSMSIPIGSVNGVLSNYYTQPIFGMAVEILVDSKMNFPESEIPDVLFIQTECYSPVRQKISDDQIKRIKNDLLFMNVKQVAEKHQKSLSVIYNIKRGGIFRYQKIV